MQIKKLKYVLCLTKQGAIFVTSKASVTKKRYYLLSFFALIFLGYKILFLHHGAFERVTASITYPFIITSAYTVDMIESIGNYFHSYQTLACEHKRLKEKYNELLESVTITLGTQQYMEETDDLRDFKKRYQLSSSILGKIIVKRLSSQEQIILINKGSAHGIASDMIALYKLQIIGRVIEVYDYYCKVLLITDKRCKVASYTNTTQAHGIIEGKNDISTCNMSLVNHLQPIGRNDFVFSSGEGRIFPEGFCLGIISDYEKKPEDLYYLITIKPMVDIEELTHCLLTNNAKISLHTTK